MELNPLENVAITDAVARVDTLLSSATMSEMLAVILLPILSLFISVSANRFIDKLPQKSLGIALVDYTAPLLAPLLSVLFTFIAMGLFHTLGWPTLILPLAVKVSIAWLAIQLVLLMSARRMTGWFIALAIIPITLLHLFGVWDEAIEALTTVKFSVGSVELNLYLILKGIVTIIALQWIASFTVNMTDSRLRRIKSMRASNRTLILKMFQIGMYCFIFLIGMQMLGINLTALSVFGGALGVGLGFGLQKIASNFISGIILLFEKSIEPGDLIELIDGTSGTVRQTYARYTLLEMQDGKEILIPNEEFISQRVVSWTHSHKKARVEIVLHVTFDADVALARRLMVEAAKSHPKRLKAMENQAYVTAFTDLGIEIKHYFWIENIADGRLEPKSDVMQAIAQAFKEHGISFAQPSREVRVTQGALTQAEPKPAPKKKSPA